MSPKEPSFDATRPAPAGDSSRVPLRVPAGVANHEPRMPPTKDVFGCQRGFARVLDMPCGRRELAISIFSVAAPDKKLITSTEGHAGEAPIIHQAVLVKATIDPLDSAFAEERKTTFPPGGGRMIPRTGSSCSGRSGARNRAILASALTLWMMIAGVPTALRPARVDDLETPAQEFADFLLLSYGLLQPPC